METRNYWNENGYSVNYNNYNSNDGFVRAGGDQLNFAAESEDEAEYPTAAYLKKAKVSRQDPMSHRIIEKRRRDRMNNCLADLSRLIPPEYLKKGRGRVEKTQIIEMAIRHLKFLQERANATDRQHGEDHFRAGYQDAVSEVLRFLIEVHGYSPGDGLCLQLASHMQKHCDFIAKGEPASREKFRPHMVSSSETTSSSSSSHGFAVKPSVITHGPPPAPPVFTSEPYDEQQSDTYPMECDRVLPQSAMPAENEGSPDSDPLPLDGRRRRESTLRTVRKSEQTEDYLHSYKFKNSIERRFSKAQDNEAADMLARTSKLHKRRRALKPVPSAPTSTSTSVSTSTEEMHSTSPQDTSSESPLHHQYEKPPLPTQYVPVFALNSLGKYYVPLSVEAECLANHAAPYAALDARVAPPLHPVTIHVSFQPCLSYHVKSERRQPAERDWHAAD